MAARLWNTITTRLTAPPPALKIHAVLVLAAALLLSDTRVPWWWARPAIVVILLWPLLRGSFFVWLVQLVGLGFVMIDAVMDYRTVANGPPGYSVFIEVPAFFAVTAAVAAAWLLLLLPTVRGWCRTDPGRRPAVVVGLGVWIVSSFPSMALSVEVPSPDVIERTPGAVFVGSDPREPVAFYVSERGQRVCLVALAPRSTSRSCTTGRHLLLDHPRPIDVGDTLAGVVPVELERVEVVTSSGVRLATMLESDRVGVDVFYLLDAPWQDIERVVGYDAGGEALYLAEEDLPP
ncbi:MAG: hypothetical protein M3285_02870 [Actinomycetota bacterium]|nr:hypothetical protein [Actinomycetota bacterium]MDQ3954474.1 hypothetical protein [Actinomycetota bacterium]